MRNTAPIVVGVDGSGASFDAVRWAARAAELRGAPLKLISTYQDDHIYTTLAAVPADEGEAEKRATTAMLEAAYAIARRATEDSAALSVATVAAPGPTIPILLDEARSARMLVVGSRGNGAYFAEMLGSVSAGVSGHAECPVVVVRGVPAAGHRDGPVVVGVDGSTSNRDAIAVAFEEASLRGARLVAVHAWTDRIVPERYRADAAAALEAAERTVLAEGLGEWRDRYPTVTVEPIVVHDNVVGAIRELSTDAQAVVVGARGRGGFGGLSLGSTSRSLSHLVDCPLIIVRESSGR